MKKLFFDNENIAIPLAILGILVITSFTPVIQILMMYVNSAIVGVLTDFFIPHGGETNFKLYQKFNSLFLLFSFISFYYSQSFTAKILSCLITLIFLLPSVMFLLDSFVSEDPYFLLALLTSFVSGTILTLAGCLKSLKNKRAA